MTEDPSYVNGFLEAGAGNIVDNCQNSNGVCELNLNTIWRFPRMVGWRIVM